MAQWRPFYNSVWGSGRGAERLGRILENGRRLSAATFRVTIAITYLVTFFAYLAYTKPVAGSTDFKVLFWITLAFYIWLVRGCPVPSPRYKPETRLVSDKDELSEQLKIRNYHE